MEMTLEVDAVPVVGVDGARDLKALDSEIGTDFIDCVGSHDLPSATTLVRASGEIDLMSAPHLRHCLEMAFESRARVVVDLWRVTFIDASGLRVLLEAHELAAILGTTFTLRRPSRQVTRVLDITKLLGVINVEQHPVVD